MYDSIYVCSNSMSFIYIDYGKIKAYGNFQSKINFFLIHWCENKKKKRNYMMKKKKSNGILERL